MSDKYLSYFSDTFVYLQENYCYHTYKLLSNIFDLCLDPNINPYSIYHDIFLPLSPPLSFSWSHKVVCRIIIYSLSTHSLATITAATTGLYQKIPDGWKWISDALFLETKQALDKCVYTKLDNGVGVVVTKSYKMN